MKNKCEDLIAAKEWYRIAKEQDNKLAIEILENKFPELKESEGEKIRKCLIEGFSRYDCDLFNGLEIKSIISWLEKQCEQTSADKVEPKFHEGDWVVSPNGVYWHIDKISNSRYEVTSNTGESSNWPLDTKIYHKFNIQDAKEGDVLSNGKMIVIFKHFEEPSYRQHIVAYIGLDTNGDIQITDDTWNLGIDKTRPTTKEQRDLLFQKMKEAGYEWNAEKKELKKIEQKPAWSEEDEKMWSQVINEIEAIKSNSSTVFEKNIAQDKIDWLKSLKPQNTWKPSAEQMKALSFINTTGGISYVGQEQELINLYNDLKKLREK